MTEINPTTPTTNPPKAWQDLTFAERIARRLRQKLGLNADAEATITRYLERTFWLMRYDMSTARGGRYDGRYDAFPAGIREMLRTAWEAGFQAAREAELTQAALRVVAALESVHEANETGELREVERAMHRLAVAHSELLRAAQEYQEGE